VGHTTYDRLHHQSLNVGSTELIQLPEQVQFQVQRIRVAPQSYERVQVDLS